MRTALGIVLALALIAGCSRVDSSSPEAVVRGFLNAVASKDTGGAEARLTEEQRQLINREGYGAMQRYLESRFEEFRTYQITSVEVRDREAFVYVTLRLPLEPGQPKPEAVGEHGEPGRIINGVFVHSHKFTLHKGSEGWRIAAIAETETK